MLRLVIDHHVMRLAAGDRDHDAHDRSGDHVHRGWNAVDHQESLVTVIEDKATIPADETSWPLRYFAGGAFRARVADLNQRSEPLSASLTVTDGKPESIHTNT